MSHWQRLKLERLSNIKGEYFEEALKKLGYTADFTVKEVKGYYRKDEDYFCDCVLFRDGYNTQIGIKFNKEKDNTISMTVLSDWSGYSTSEKFYSDFTKEYLSAMLVGESGKQGFMKESEEELVDGRRKITLRRAA